MSIKHFTGENYQSEVVDYKGYVLIDFWAPWCGPCRQLGPIVEEYADDAEGKIKVGKMNVDENPQTPTKFGVRSIPALIILKDGQAVATKVGSLPKSALADWVDSVIK